MTERKNEEAEHIRDLDVSEAESDDVRGGSLLSGGGLGTDGNLTEMRADD